MDLTGALGAKQSKGSGKTGEIRDGVLKKTGKTPVEQAVAQFVFELAEGPVFEVFEHHATQQAVGGDSGPAEIFGTKTPPAQFFGAEAQQLVVLEQQLDFVEGDVLDGGHLFGESEEEQGRLPVSVAYHYLIDIIDYVKNDNKKAMPKEESLTLIF
jgi:hypothetical protein